jgi:TRAP-type C4-dicarboxylate transport system substrate-binding protein
MVELRHGVADIGLITPIYTKAGTHLIRIQAGFYSGAGSPETQLALYRCMAAAHEQLVHEVEGLKVLAIQGGPLPGLLTRTKPVRRLDDLKGLRIRASTELLPVLQALGADPVNMPMGEVYSSLAKGIIDGVFAPPDTFRSLHFSELTPYFTGLYTPRGAYPARAMNAERWASLRPLDQSVLEDSIAVWEAALSRQTSRAVQMGLQTAKDAKVEMIDIDPSAQQAFDRLYLAEAAKSAAALSRYGIDGSSVFRTARASMAEDGTVACKQGEGT